MGHFGDPPPTLLLTDSLRHNGSRSRLLRSRCAGQERLLKRQYNRVIPSFQRHLSIRVGIPAFGYYGVAGFDAAMRRRVPTLWRSKSVSRIFGMLVFIADYEIEAATDCSG